MKYCERRYFHAVHIFALWCSSNVRKNIYIVKITFIMLHRGNNIKNTKINLHEIANIWKCAKFIHAKISTFTAGSVALSVT